jgi:hypothetical protein
VDKGTEQIEDDELLYRRVPESTRWYDSENHLLSDQAFAPHKKDDATGLSLVRAKYSTPEAAAKGRPGKSYYLAVLRAADLRENGINVAPRPTACVPGHVELPDLNAENRKSTATLEAQRLLAEELWVHILGPFQPSD